MRKWGLRIVGTLNILMALCGVCYSWAHLSWNWHRLPPFSRAGVWTVFFCLTGLTLTLVAGLTYFGWRLLRADLAAMRGTAILFGLEIVYILIDLIVFGAIITLSGRVDPRVNSFWSMSYDAMVPQMLTGYPLLGLIAMIAMRPRRHALGTLPTQRRG
jgi:hypothetical protein